MSRRAPTVLVCLALALTACSGGSDGERDPDDPQAVADLLAERLTEHTLTGVPLLDTAAADDHAALVAPLDEVPTTVTAGEVSQDGDTEATAELTWSWDLAAGEDWTYTTTARLVGTDAGWSVDWRPDTLEPSLTGRDRLGVFTVPGERGRITGDGDAPIVVDRPVQRFGIDKTRVAPAQEERSARRVARALDIEVAPYVARVVEAGDSAFVEGLVVRAADASAAVRSAFDDVPGAVVIADELPLAPTRDFASSLLGRVGPATQEIVEESEGRVEPDDEVGLSGLQARYDEVLAPTEGVEVVAARGEGAEERRRTLVEVAPVDGEDLATTLDPAVQRAAERVLADVGPAAGIVALRPSDGAVLAAADGPGSDGLAVATQGRYAPGSTFKVVTSLALLRAGVGPDDTLRCPSTVDVDGRDFSNYDDYPASGLGPISLRRAVAESCNTAFIGARDSLGEDDLAEAAAALGLGEDADVGFGSFFGEVPPAEGATDEAASTIGQGRVLASPLAMAAVAASVAAGRTVVPSLLPAVEPDAVEPAEPVTAPEARTLRGLMRAVVTEGSGGFLADLPGEVGAKTGTAEYGEPDASGELPTHAWMIATRGDLAVAVFVEDGASGSATAGPLLEDLLRAVPSVP